MSEEIKKELKRLRRIEKELERRKARADLLSFTKRTFEKYKINWHNSALCDYLNRWSRGEIRYLIVEMPPRHGKSELVSRQLPAYMLGHNPDEHIISCSYSADLASKMNRDVQRIIDSQEYTEIFPGTNLAGMREHKFGKWARSTDFFEVVGSKGFYRSAGVGGGITGMGFTKGIIDDFIKNKEEAESEVYREKIWEWYTSTFFTRMEEGAGILITATRWHEDDLIGRILDSDHGEQWKVVKFKAMREEDDNPDDPREVGEALWPEVYPLKELEEIRTALGSRNWVSLYQQEPTAAEGSIFKRDWFKFYDELPDGAPQRRVQSWDFAAKKKKENDFTVCTTWEEYKTGKYLIDLWMKKVEYPLAKAQVKIEYVKHKPHNILIEDASAGQQVLQELKNLNLPLKAVNPGTDKILRANQASPPFEAGNVYFPFKDFIKTIIEQLCSFPNAKYDDIVDSVSQYINWARENPTLIAPVTSKGTRATRKFLKGDQTWRRAGTGRGASVRRRTFPM